MNDKNITIVVLKKWLEVARKLGGRSISEQQSMVSNLLGQRQDASRPRPSHLVTQLQAELNNRGLKPEAVGSSKSELKALSHWAEVEWCRQELGQARRLQAEQVGGSNLLKVRELLATLNVRPEELRSSDAQLQEEIRQAELKRDHYLLKQAETVSDPLPLLKQLKHSPQELGLSLDEFERLRQVSSARWYIQQFRHSRDFRQNTWEMKQHAENCYKLMVEFDITPERIGTTYEEFEQYV